MNEQTKFAIQAICKKISEGMGNDEKYLIRIIEGINRNQPNDPIISQLVELLEKIRNVGTKSRDIDYNLSEHNVF